jgi:YaiO family outer membrane protein
MSMPIWIMCAMLFAHQAPPPAPPPATGPASPVLEIGATHHEVWSEGAPRLGPWRIVHGSLAWQPPLRVRPRIELERQSRPSGGHYRASAGVYVDWTPTFYSYQALTVAPSTSADRRFYPSRRADVRLFWKIPEHEGVTLAAGYTGLTFGAPQRSHILNVGTILYGRHAIVQGTLYVNRNEPGTLHSAAANLSVQVGAEGRGWYGASISGGRELYRLGTLGTGGTADFTTATVGGFVRQWLTKTAGVHATFEYQRIMTSYSRVGVTAHLFVGF